MNPKVKASWLAALRGGKYKQGRSGLRLYDGPNSDGLTPIPGDSFCCLGVLTDLWMAEQNNGSCWSTGGVHVVDEYGEHETETAFLHAAVMAWAGLDEKNPCVSPSVNGLGVDSLAGLNDSQGLSAHDFDAIADVIEAEL